jgi:ectoine hydroxylase-related dioxygenase (phytanoyl-CoA dioxygenase family)
VVTIHQELAYWGLGEIDGIFTAWRALSPATPQSGCMNFVKGSHKNPIVPHADNFDELNLLSRGQEVKVDVAEEDKSSGALGTGEISLHHGLMIHGSGGNTSHDRRIGVVMRFLSPHVKKPNNAPNYSDPCAAVATPEISPSATHQGACFIQTIFYYMRKFEQNRPKS